MEALGNVVEAELHFNGPDIDVELRRVQLVHNEDLMKDLNSVSRSGAYVESSCLDIWCAAQNEVLFKTGRRDVLILSIPASQAIFYDHAGEKEDLDPIALKWKESRYSRDLKNVLIPVNLHNQHWCLLIVDLTMFYLINFNLCFLFFQLRYRFFRIRGKMTFRMQFA